MKGKHPKPKDLILVAFMPTPEDLDLVRVLGWYRIPLRSAPKVVAVDFLAFYQPATFGKKKWLVEYCAPVFGHELVTRKEIIKSELDHPSADEKYFKIQLGDLIHLQNPIHAPSWKRMTFLYTTGEKLLNAKTNNDLIVDDEERKYLWRALRERAEQQEQYTVSPLPPADISGEQLLTILGMNK